MAWKQSTFRSNNHRKTRLDAISRKMLFIWLMLAGLIIILAPHRWTNRLQFTFERLFSWPLKIGSNFSLARSTQQPLSIPLDRDENKYKNYSANLEQEIKQLQLKIQQLSGIRNRLSLEGVSFPLADIISGRISDTRAELTINRGTDDGLALNQYVMADYCIIGTISELSSRTARVKLFTDPTSKINVKIGDLEVYRIMKGTGNLSAKILDLQTTHDVKAGDNVIACKVPGLLDVPMIMGTVAQCENDKKNPIVWDITVQPACDISNIKNVAVLIMNPKK
jgi:rod shape-determining protein MreC